MDAFAWSEATSSSEEAAATVEGAWAGGVTVATGPQRTN